MISLFLCLITDKFERVSMPQGTPTKVKKETPPYNGFGSEEDSLQSCLHLIPKPPRRCSNIPAVIWVPFRGGGRDFHPCFNKHSSFCCSLLRVWGYSSVVEHSTADREVPGSNPGAPSFFFSILFITVMIFFLSTGILSSLW